MVLGLMDSWVARARTEGSRLVGGQGAGDDQLPQSVPDLLVDGPGVPVVQADQSRSPSLPRRVCRPAAYCINCTSTVNISWPGRSCQGNVLSAPAGKSAGKIFPGTPEKCRIFLFTWGEAYVVSVASARECAAASPALRSADRSPARGAVPCGYLMRKVEPIHAAQRAEDRDHRRQPHPSQGDTGSPEVQVAILTERINAADRAHAARTPRTSTPTGGCCRWSASAAACWTISRRRTSSGTAP